MEIEIRFHDDFEKWFEKIKDNNTVFRIQSKIDLMRVGNFGHSKSVGKGVSELVLDFGPGYRIYYGQKGDRLVLIIAGSSKKDQQGTITRAQEIWADIKGGL